MPLLKPRVRITTSNRKLKQEILRQRIKSSKEEIKLNKVIENVKMDSIKFKKLDLIIAGERKNAEPLLRNTYYQENPHLKKDNNKHIKMYYKTMKPYGNNKENIDYTKNERWRPSYEIKNLRENKNQKQYSNVGTSMDNFDLNDNQNYYHQNFNNKSKLVLSYYDKNVPDIKYFNLLVNKYDHRTIYNEINKNEFNNDKDKIKENIYLSTIQNKNNRNRSIKKEITDKELSKFPFIIEQFKKYNKENSLEEKENDLGNKIHQENKYFLTETTKNIFNE